MNNMPQITEGTAEGINLSWLGMLKDECSTQWSVKDHWGILKQLCGIIIKMYTVICRGGQLGD